MLFSWFSLIQKLNFESFSKSTFKGSVYTGRGIWSIHSLKIAKISFYDKTWLFFIKILMETLSLGTVSSYLTIKLMKNINCWPKLSLKVNFVENVWTNCQNWMLFHQFDAHPWSISTNINILMKKSSDFVIKWFSRNLEWRYGSNASPFK